MKHRKAQNEWTSTNRKNHKTSLHWVVSIFSYSLLIFFLCCTCPLVAAQDILFFDDFSDGDMNGWEVGDSNPANGEDYWGIVNTGLYTPQPWCAVNSDGGAVVWENYDNNMNAYMRRDIDLYGHENCLLRFDHYIASETPHDYLSLLINGTEVWRDSGYFNWDGQPKTEIDLGAYDGQSVTIEFLFHSDYLINSTEWPGDGAFVDNIEISGDPLNPSGRYLWVPTTYDDKLFRIDTGDLSATDVLDINFGNSPVIAVDDTSVWIITGWSEELIRVNQNDLNSSTISLSGYIPQYIAVDDTFVWMTTSDQDSLIRLRKCDLSINILQDIENPTGLAVDENYIWVGVNSAELAGIPDTLIRINKSDLSSTVLQIGSYNRSIGIDENYIYIENYCNASINTCSISRIDKHDLAIDTIDSLYLPTSIVADDDYLWVAHGYSSRISRVSKIDFAVTTINIGYHPYSIFVDNDYAWVPISGDDTVARINKSDLSFVELPIGDNPKSYGDITGYLYDRFFSSPNTVSGRVQSRHWPHDGVPGVTVQTDTGEITTTDNYGYYELWDVPGGNRVITSSHDDYWAIGGSITTSQSVSVTEDKQCIDFNDFGCKGTPEVSITTDDADGTVYPGQTFNVTVTLNNLNYALSDIKSYLDLSFNDSDVTVGTPIGTGWTSVTPFSVGSAIWAVDDQGNWSQVTSTEYLLSGYRDGSFGNNDTYSFTVPLTVNSNATGGTITLKYRGTIGDYRDPVSSGSGTLDQQGLNVNTYDIAVVSSIPVIEDIVFDFENSSIYLCFSIPMNTNSVEYSISIYDDIAGSDLSGSWEWNDDNTCGTFSTVEPITLSDFTLYIGSGQATSEGGISLDGDEDGQPGGDWYKVINHPIPQIEAAPESQEIFPNMWGSIEKEGENYTVNVNTEVPGIINALQPLSQHENAKRVISVTVTDEQGKEIYDRDLVNELIIAFQNKAKYLNLEWNSDFIIWDSEKAPESRVDNDGQTYWIVPPAFLSEEAKDSTIFSGIFWGLFGDGTDDPEVRQDLYEEFFIQLILQDSSIELDKLIDTKLTLMIMNTIEAGILPVEILKVLTEILATLKYGDDLFGLCDVSSVATLFTKLGEANHHFAIFDNTEKIMRVQNQLENWHHFFESFGAFLSVVQGVNKLKNKVLLAILRNSLALAEGYQRRATLEYFLTQSHIQSIDPVIQPAWEVAKEAHEEYAGSIVTAFMEDLKVIDSAVDVSAWVINVGVLSHAIWVNSAVAAKIAAFKPLLPIAIAYHGYWTFRNAQGELRLSAIAATMESKMFEELQGIGQNIGSYGGNYEFDRLYYQVALNEFRHYSGFLFYDSIYRCINDHLVINISDFILDLGNPDEEWEEFQEDLITERERCLTKRLQYLPPDYLAASESRWLRNLLISNYNSISNEFFIQVGEILPLNFYLTNDGGNAVSLYATVSHSFHLEANNPDPVWDYFSPSTLVYGKGDTEETGPTHEIEWPMYEIYSEFYAAGSSNQYTLDFIGETSGLASIFYRTAMEPEGCTYFVRDPLSSDIEDQQEWPAKSVIIEVFEEPSPNLSSDIQNITLMEGEELEITFELNNTGGATEVAYFDLSHSEGLEVLRVSPAFDFMSYGVGDLIWTNSIGQVPAVYPLYSAIMYWFPGNESREFKVLIRAKTDKIGNHWIKYRAALLPYTYLGQSSDGATYVRAPESGALDQQGWPANEVAVSINENLRPVITQWSPGTSHIDLEIAENITFNISAYDPNGRELTYKWWFDEHIVSTETIYNYTPGSSDVGSHTLRVEVSDNELTAVINWNINVLAGINISSFAAAFGSTISDSNYSNQCDIDKDEDVDGSDLAEFIAGYDGL